MQVHVLHSVPSRNRHFAKARSILGEAFLNELCSVINENLNSRLRFLTHRPAENPLFEIQENSVLPKGVDKEEEERSQGEEAVHPRIRTLEKVLGNRISP